MIVQWVFVMLCLFRNSVELNPIDFAPAPSIVLTLDVSESMDTRSRISKLEGALRKWIEFDVFDGVHLGIVQFSSNVKLLSDLVPISKESRQQLIQLIPTNAQGETCLRDGLKRALQLVEYTESGGMVILITDIEISEPGQDIKDMFDEVKQSRVKIVTIMMGDEDKSNDIEHLTTLTGGLAYNISDEEGVDEILFALRGALSLVRTAGTVTSTGVNNNPETSPTIETSSQNVTTDVDNYPETSPTIETSSQNVTTDVDNYPETSPTIETITTIGEKTGVLHSDAHSSSWYLAIGILVGIVVVIIILLIVIMLCRRRYRITRINGKYILVKERERQQL